MTTESFAESPQLLSRQAAIEHWDRRHARESDLRSGGDVGLSEGSNEAFYAVRLGELIRLISGRVEPSGQQYVLDAGCGKGWFSRAIARCGYSVDGIDTSATAVAFATSLGGGPRYFQSSLSEWSSSRLYDVVAAIDVLFHVLDDDEWRASVVNLATMTKLGGLLIIADGDWPERRVLGNYIVHRPRTEYDDVLRRAGFVWEAFAAYSFRHNELGFHAFRRVG